MSKFALMIAPLILSGVCACSSDDDDPAETSEETELGFFVTSTTHDGNLGGLSGADATCETLAAAVGAGSRTWKAYLSAENNGTPIHAKDRIGSGPWYNADGDLVAQNLAALHAATLVGNADLFITEKGEKVNGQWNGVSPNEHDIVTGSDATGSLLMGAMNSTCTDWTSNTLTPGPQVGHSDGMGPGMNVAEARYTSWNGGHPAAGCSAASLAERGSAGRFYCFAAD
jgi:hypothetical protein